MSGAASGEAGKLGSRDGVKDLNWLIDGGAKGGFPFSGKRWRGDEMPARWGSEPAFEFAGPGHLRQLLTERVGAILLRQSEEVEILQDAAIPPGGEASVLAAEGLGINPRSIFIDGGGLQLIYDGQLEPIGQVAALVRLDQPGPRGATAGGQEGEQQDPKKPRRGHRRTP